MKIIQSELSFVSVEVFSNALTGVHKSFINMFCSVSDLLGSYVATCKGSAGMTGVVVSICFEPL